MSLRAMGALVRASWDQARSYRLSLFLQAGGLVVSVIPTYFIAGALQETMASTIAAEAQQYFAFIVVGSVAIMFVSAALTTLPATIQGGISSGYFESLLMTRAPVASIMAGLTGYTLILTLVRSTGMLLVGWVLGAQIVWGRSMEAVVILVLLIAAHWGLGLISSALVVAFRTAGPLARGVMVVSTLFGGVYYPTSAIPSWLGAVSELTPLAYGLRALRRVLLRGEGLGAVSDDLVVLTLIAIGLLATGTLCLQAGLQYARRAGSLGAY